MLVELMINNYGKSYKLPKNYTSDKGYQFRGISEIAKLLYASADLEEFLKRLTQGVCEHSHWTMSSIQVLDVEQNISIPIRRFDPYSQIDAPFPKGWDTNISPVGDVLESRKPLILKDAANQDEYPAFRDDARRRGYHTVVMTPLEVLDEKGRPMVFSVISRKVVDTDENELSFLKCVADLTDIAFHKMRRLKKEAAHAQELRNIVQNLTAALSNTLEVEAVSNLSEGLTQLFPAGWFAIDLTTGRGIYDPQSPPPLPLTLSSRAPDQLIEIALKAEHGNPDEPIKISIDDEEIDAVIEPLKIDGSRVGALFLFGTDVLSEFQKVAAEAGRLALSTFILRNFIVFKTRRVSARRLLSRLFSHDWRDVDEVINEAHALDFDLTRSVRLLIIRNSEDSRFEDGVHSFLLRSAQGLFGPALSSIVEGDFYLLLYDSEEIQSEKIKQDFFKRAQTLLSNDIYLSVSDGISDINDIAKAQDTCIKTLSFAQTTGTLGWVDAQMLGALPEIMASVDKDVIERYLDNTLSLIAPESIAKRNTALRTIEVFLDSGRRFQETADTLEIHVSTLRYRLEQMSEKYGFDFSNNDSCFELEFALKLLHFKNSYER